LEGLEATELKLSTVRQENIKLRLDSAYFAKPMLKAEMVVRSYSKGHHELGDLFTRFVKGVFDINADCYSDKGVPFLRILNLKNGVIDDSNIVLIPEFRHQDEIKTELRRGDIVLSKTAYPAASLVTLDRCNTSQDTIATSLSDFGRRTYRPEVIVAYLNCTFGQGLLWRQFQGNVQLHLSLDDGRKVPIPRLGSTLQAGIAEAFQLADAANRDAVAQLQSAETSLMSALGLENWKAPEPLSYIRSSRHAFAAGRLDAEHFQEGHYALREVLTSYRTGYVQLCDLSQKFANGAEIREYQATGTPYLRIGDLKNLSINSGSVVYVDPVAAAEVLDKVRLKTGDVLISRSGSLAVSAVVEREWESALISSHLIRLRIVDNTFDPYFVALFLKTLPGRMQIMQWSNGGVQPEISQPSLGQLIVPKVKATAQQDIRRRILEAATARQRSTDLLNAAKRAVEIAIEQDEKSAMAHLESNT
jgi:hypothetical protein